LFNLFLQRLDVVIGRARNVKTEFDIIEQTMISQGQGAVTQGIDAIINGLGEIFSKQKSVAQGFKDIARATIGIFAQFLRDVAIAIIKLQIFNMMKQSPNGIVRAIGEAGAASVSINHSGGFAGFSNRTRRMDPMLFANAPRYHQGGLPGLANNEVMSILERGEEVLEKSDPRNALNGGLNPAPTQESKGTRFVFVDDREKVPEAMASAEGEEVIVQVIRRNAATIKQFMR
jgi:hypothetical protein